MASQTADERQKLIDDFIRKNGVTVVPAQPAPDTGKPYKTRKRPMKGRNK